MLLVVFAYYVKRSPLIAWLMRIDDEATDRCELGMVEVMLISDAAGVVTFGMI